MAVSLEEPFLLSSYGVDGSASTSTSALRSPLQPVSHSRLVRREAKQQQQQSIVLAGSAADKGKSTRDSKGKGIAVTTVQRNGIHFIDLEDQSVLASLTVAPTTTFTCPAASFTYPAAANNSADAASSTSSAAPGSGGLRTRKTVVGVSREGGRNEVWTWTESENRDGTTAGEASCSVKTFESRAICIDAQHLEDRLIVVFDDGSVVVAEDDNLVEKARARVTSASDAPLSQLVKAYFGYPLSNTKLGLSRRHTEDVILALITHRSSTTEKEPAGKRRKSDVTLKQQTSANGVQPGLVEIHVTLIAVSKDGRRVSNVASAKLGTAAEIADVQVLARSCELAIVYANGRLAINELSITPASTVNSASLLVTPRRTLQLSQTALLTTNARLLSLSASSPYMLLVAFRANSKDTLVFTLWEIQHLLLISEQAFTVPTAPGTESSHNGQINSVPPYSFEVAVFDDVFTIGLSVSPASNTTTATARASSYGMIVRADSVPTLASLAGRLSLTQKYAVAEQEEDQQGVAPAASTAAGAGGVGRGTQALHDKEQILRQTRSEILRQLRPLLSHDPKYGGGTGRDVEAATRLFNDLTSAARHENGITPRKLLQDRKFAVALLRLALPAAAAAAVSPSTTSSMPTSGSSSSQQQQQQQQQQVAVAASAIVLRLVQGRHVADSDIPGGITAALVARREWTLLEIAFSTLVDIPETSLVSALQARITALLVGTSPPSTMTTSSDDQQRKSTATNATKMEVDASSTEAHDKKKNSSDPSKAFSKFLCRVVASPTSKAALRAALRSQLSVNSLIPIMGVLEQWLASPTTRQLVVSVPQPSERKDDGNDGLPTQGKADEIPDLPKIIDFTSALLDAHLVSILQDPELEDVVLRIRQHIKRQLAITAMLQSLQGPLDEINLRSKASDGVISSTRETAAAELPVPSDTPKALKKGLQREMRRKAEVRRKMQEHAGVAEYVVEEFEL